MSANKIVAAMPTATPASGGTRASSALPADLLQQTCKRVATVALVFASIWSIALIMNNVVVRLIEGMDYVGPGWPLPGNVIAPVGVVISIAMVVAAGRLHHKPELLLNIGLGFMVGSCFLIALINQWEPTPPETRISWIVGVILAYPAIAPNTPSRTLLASIAAASMDPLGLGVTALRGAEIPLSAFDLVWAFLPNYIAAGEAVLPAHIIRGLSRQVKKARELGSYRLGEILGRGGMGEVHRATHRMLARPAAIKLIRPEVLGASSDAAARVITERFKREAQAAAALRSPHTIELYDFGITDDGTFYYVMELLDGLDLETLVERFGPVPPERAVHFMRQTCSSIGEAHAQGLIHRDVKPSNIYASRLGLTVDFVKVLDFGLVKSTGSSQEVTLTAPEVTTGTPAFMAPEVALGEEVDRRADVYALGCVAYWLLTGQLVFDADSPIKMIYRHIQNVPVPPSQRTELDVPRDLEELILASLEKRPDDRPSDAEELGRLFGGLQINGAWTDERAQRWWETHFPSCPPGEPCEEQVLEPALVSEE